MSFLLQKKTHKLFGKPSMLLAEHAPPLTNANGEAPITSGISECDCSWRQNIKKATELKRHRMNGP